MKRRIAGLGKWEAVREHEGKLVQWAPSFYLLRPPQPLPKWESGERRDFQPTPQIVPLFGHQGAAGPNMDPRSYIYESMDAREVWHRLVQWYRGFISPR
jgi:hypothetical protein